ncbi:hypothetical protein ACSMXM_05750 [Pacificimonas sp. ICDLI1SI03]
MFDEWRLAVNLGPESGTVTWLFNWYRSLDRFQELSFKTRRDYTAYMKKVEELTRNSGGTFGDAKIEKVDATVANVIRKRLEKTGKQRSATYALQTCRRVWEEALRHTKKTGVDHNPFSKMDLKSTAAKGNRAISRQQYDLLRSTAHAEGLPDLAVGCALSFELAQRVSDAFSLITGDDAERGFFWEDYEPGVQIALRQSKTGTFAVWPLSDNEGPLYPELETELANAPRTHKRIVPPRDESKFGKQFRSIRDKAGLPKWVTPTSLRHGGATEVGDAGTDDIRPITHHKTLQQTATYNKAGVRKSRIAARKRRDLIEGDSE